MRKALAFLTPFGRASVPDARTMTWFPVVGALIGAVVGGVWWGSGEWWSPLVAAALVIVVDLAITGLLHADGLVDSADGLLPQVDRATRLRIMAEPTVGAYGVLAAVAVLGMRLATLASMPANVWLLAAGWCAGRTVMAVAARSLPYARGTDGLAHAFVGGGGWPVGGLGVVLAVALAVIGGGWPFAVAIAGGFMVGGAVILAGYRRLGGFTGDVLGAAGLLTETAVLLVASARW